MCFIFRKGLFLKNKEIKKIKLETAEMSAGICGFVISAAVFCVYNFQKIKNNTLKLLEIIEIILANTAK